MPRPTRGRPAAPARAANAPPPRSPSADPASDSNDAGGQREREQPRGRSRRIGSAGRLSIGEQDAIQAANRTRDAALDRLAVEDATTTSGSSARHENSGSPVEVGRRAMATPAHRRDMTGLDLADDVFGDLDESFADSEMPHGDVSSMSFSSLRPRSRQSSFIGRNDPPIRPSSRGGNTPGIGSSFNIGVFRRRAREPSILGTSRKPLQGPSRAAKEPESESEGEFEPEAESTPVNNRRRTQHVTDVQRESSPEAPPLSSSRKRKSEDANHSTVRPEKVLRAESSEQPGEESSSELSDLPPSPQQPHEDSDSELSELSSPQELPLNLFQRPVTPVNEDEIAAPPASSGSEGPDIWPDIRTLAKRRRRPSVTTPARLDNLSDISSPPSLTHSPNFEESRAAKTRRRPVSRQQASPKLTTAELTNLLPKRRYKKTRDPLDLDSDEELDTTGLGHEDDELSYLDTQAARRRKGSRPPTSGSRGGRAGNPVLKPKQTTAAAKSASRDVGSYSRRSSDKENEENERTESEDEEGESRFVPLADDTFDTGAVQSTGDSPSADELKQAAKKFQEVDKWELEFEEVTETESQQDSR